MKQPVTTDGAPAPIGPYSQGIVCSGKLLYVSGQTAKHPQTGEIKPDVRAQTERCMENIKAIVEKAGATLANVVKVNAYLKNMATFAEFNDMYARYFPKPYPARTTVGADLPGGTLVEIDAIVALE
ncbi:MAG: Rid family detoxifying hydrolase [Spirochaetia bacterium]|jgi:2-iminobutanoate/2-iminopropanoate deaminase